MRYTIFIILFIGLSTSNLLAQIEVLSPAPSANKGYDSLATLLSEETAYTWEGQELIIMPVDTFWQSKAYTGFYTKALGIAELDMKVYHESGLKVPKNKQLIYAPNPSNPFYSLYDSLRFKTFRVSDVIKLSDEKTGGEEVLYLKLEDTRSHTIIYYNVPLGMDIDEHTFLVKGHWAKLAKSLAGQKLLARRKACFKDFYTGLTFTSVVGEIYNFEKLIVTIPPNEEAATLCALLRNNKGNALALDYHLFEFDYAYSDEKWASLFLNVDIKDQFKISEANWQRVIKRELWIGMSKAEALAVLGQPDKKTYSSRDAIMKSDTWEYLNDFRLTFEKDKLNNCWNYRPEILMPSLFAVPDAY